MTSQASWNRFGSMIDLIYVQEPWRDRVQRTCGEWTPPLPTFSPSPPPSRLHAHSEPWLPGPTSSVCVLRED